MKPFFEYGEYNSLIDQVESVKFALSGTIYDIIVDGVGDDSDICLDSIDNCINMAFVIVYNTLVDLLNKKSTEYDNKIKELKKDEISNV